VTVLFTGDEEVGSPSTRDLIEAEAARHAFVGRAALVRRGSGVARPAQSLQIEARDGIASGDDAACR
jgi:acetylornithine deacetylase/succinyl-diaminopimelate desuccinylase-like protein